MFGDGNLIPLGIRLAIPEGWCLILKDRSGNAAKRGLRIAAGVIDSSYRGEVKVLLDVVDDDNGHGVYFKAGEKICQGLLIPVPDAVFLPASNETELLLQATATSRGIGGFGSTDVLTSG